MMHPPSTHKPRRRWRKRTRFSVTMIVLSLLAVLSINAPGLLETGYRSQVQAVARLPEFSLPGRGDHMLVISPHPDDETLCCAGTIQRALERGASVSVVWLTSGDGFTWDAIVLERQLIPNPIDMVKLGQRRMLEARTAGATLGVPKANLFFLGYPDGGLRKMLEQPETLFRSRYTKLVRVPYFGVVTQNAAHTGTNLERDLENMIDLVKPTMVLAPSVLDAHPDHRATGELIQRILQQRHQTAMLRSWIVHGGLEWPLPKSWHTDLPLVPSPRGRTLPWQRVSLNPEQVQVKVRATRAYTSQVIALGRFMAAFSRTNELLSEPGAPER
jgi:LmbE family N-acetylglucosaminyl deacetylase